MLLGYPDQTFRGAQPVTRYEVATILLRLMHGGLLDRVAFGPAELQTLTGALNEVAGELEALHRRVASLESGQQAQDTQLHTVNTQLASLTTTVRALPAAPLSDLHLQDRLQALEEVVRASASVADQLTPLSQTAALQAQIDDLKIRLAGVAATPQAALPMTATFPPARPVEAPKNPAQSSGLQVEMGVAATTPVHPLDFGAGVSLGVSFPSGFGGQVGVQYRPGSKALDLDALVVKKLNFQGLEPYIGVGVGGVLSPGRNQSTDNRFDPFGELLVGVNYRFNEGIALFGDVSGRYFWSNNGAGTSLTEGQSGGASGHANIGLKFRF